MRLLLIILFQYSILSAQSSENPVLSQYDFWVGRWDASWDEGEGKIGTGTNTITKVLDDKVLHENFEILTGINAGFKGMSLSVYNPNKKEWKQAWTDNQGGYFDFTGLADGDKKFFQTALQKLPDGKSRIQRMVFYNIRYDSFTWDWEASNDEGKNWNLLWRINYKRMK